VEKLKELRINAGFSQRELATRAGLTPGAVWQVEHRKSGSPATLKKLADVLGVEVGDFYPKVQASLWPEEEPERRNPEPGEAARRLSKVPEALGEYIEGRAKQHDAEIRDPASPHFASATAGTLYLADIEDEFEAWCSWAARKMPEIMLSREGLGKQIVGTLLDTFSVMGVMLLFNGTRKKARRRIQAMESVPDELATRRLKVSTARGEESRKRLIELEVASG